MKDKINILKNSSLYLLLLMVISLILTTFLFIINIPISKINIILSFIISSIIMFYIIKNKKEFFKTCVLTIAVIIISLLISTFTFDRSSDGNTYHKDAIGNLYNGWNPNHESSEDFVKNNLENNNYNMHNFDIWKDHYAKANWILEANFYSLTDNIESGKTVNYIFMYILFTLSLTYFYSKIGNKSLILSTIITFNPITCNQLYTFYNDQLGTSLLFILILSLIKIIDNKYEEKINIKFLYLFSTFIIITNIKFNIMGYSLIFTFIFMLYYLYLKYKENKFSITFKKLFISYIILFIISFGLVGYSTYITNLKDHGNMFYPIYGKDKVDIITKQQPEDFLHKNVLEKFYIGTFAETNNLQNNKNYKIKIPFTFKVKELKESMSIDTRLSGFGIFYSGLFLLSILTLIIYLKKSQNKEEKTIITLITLINILLIFIINESWWARYNPNNYLFIIILIYLLLKYSKYKVLNNLIIFITLINSLIILSGNTYYTFKESYKIHNDLKELSNKNVSINFNLGDMTGILYNLKDYKINYKLNKNNLKNISYYKYLNYEVIK